MYAEAQHIKDTNFIDLKLNHQEKALEKIKGFRLLVLMIKAFHYRQSCNILHLVLG